MTIGRNDQRKGGLAALRYSLTKRLFTKPSTGEPGESKVKATH